MELCGSTLKHLRWCCLLALAWPRRMSPTPPPTPGTASKGTPLEAERLPPWNARFGHCCP